MVKKLRGGGPAKWTVNPRKVERWLEQAHGQMLQGDFRSAIASCQQVIRNTSLMSRSRADALLQMGAAQGMLQDFEAAYTAFTEALKISPRNPSLWYNRGLACRFVMRSGQSVRDLERAVELEGSGEMAADFADALDLSRRLALRGMELRGPGFSLEQLIEQEELFQQATELMQQEAWSGAEAGFRRVIAMGDCLPQPWGNLGICLIMQQRRPEGEAALRRALEIDPEYSPAIRNLEVFKSMDPGETPLLGEVLKPFDGRELKKSLTIRFSDP